MRTQSSLAATGDNKGRRRYQLKTFLLAFACIWVTILSFAWLSYLNERSTRIDIMVQRLSLAAQNVVDAYRRGDDISAYLDFMETYLEASAINGIAVQVYDTHNGQLLYSMGDLIDRIPQEAHESSRQRLPDGTQALMAVDPDGLDSDDRIFYYSSRLSPEGDIEVRTYLPSSDSIDAMLSINHIFWLIILGEGIIGTFFVWVFTAHQAKNIGLLHDFASRAVTDRDFIPMGDFPADELGDISRWIVAIYNSRLQANVRRDREHAVALKAIEEKNNLKRTLTNNISHELKTPVGILRGYLEMLLGNPDMPEEDRTHFLKKASENVERMVAMLNDLSTITRLDELAQNVPIKDVDFHELLFSVADSAITSGLTGDMDFSYNVPLNCRVRGNEGLLSSLLNNLIKNAVAYSQGTMIGVELLGRSDSFFTFVFYDNGRGVGAEHLPHLFDRFYRVDSGRARKSGGTGLGLPIVKSAVNAMGGSISVRNRRGGGLEFVFTLPRVKDHDDGDKGGDGGDGGQATPPEANPATPRGDA